MSFRLQSTRSLAKVSSLKCTSKNSVRLFSNAVLRSNSLIGYEHNLSKLSMNFNNSIMTQRSLINQFVRKYSVIENDAAPTIDFNKMKEIALSNDPKYVIVDVREPDEFSAGHIPNAINIPCKSSPGALGLDPEEFNLTFGFDKPPADKTLVFYCLAGVRATMSEELAGTYGYKNRLNYVGSFKDWIANNGKIDIPEKKE